MSRAGAASPSGKLTFTRMNHHLYRTERQLMPVLRRLPETVLVCYRPLALAAAAGTAQIGYRKAPRQAETRTRRQIALRLRPTRLASAFRIPARSAGIALKLGKGLAHVASVRPSTVQASSRVHLASVHSKTNGRERRAVVERRTASVKPWATRKRRRTRQKN